MRSEYSATVRQLRPQRVAGAHQQGVPPRGAQRRSGREKRRQGHPLDARGQRDEAPHPGHEAARRTPLALPVAPEPALPPFQVLGDPAAGCGPASARCARSPSRAPSSVAAARPPTSEPTVAHTHASTHESRPCPARKPASGRKDLAGDGREERVDDVEQADPDLAERVHRVEQEARHARELLLLPSALHLAQVPRQRPAKRPARAAARAGGGDHVDAVRVSQPVTGRTRPTRAPGLARPPGGPRAPQAHEHGQVREQQQQRRPSRRRPLLPRRGPRGGRGPGGVGGAVGKAVNRFMSRR